MAEPQLVVVAGALPRGAKVNLNRAQEAIAKRWRHSGGNRPVPERQDVIPLLDGWIRRLEREAGRDEPG
jgi:hypothetical protein